MPTTVPPEHPDVLELGDADLITAVRGGDTHAYGVLFGRHREAAHRLARQLVRGPHSDDLVAESFTRVLATIQNGKGPQESFRAYLLTAMRRMHVDNVRAAQRVRPTDDESELDRHVEWIDPAEMRFEQGAAATAFASLPQRWQMVLWHLDVEGQKPGDIAPLLAMSANSVSALAYRAREGLRQAYLQGHLSADQKADCRDTTSKLGAHVRGGLAARDTARVEAHLDTCPRCMGLSMELDEVNQNLSGLLAPALLGAAASGYLAAGTSVLATLGAAVAGVKAALVGGAEAVLAPIKSAGTVATVSGPQGMAVAAVTMVAVAAGAVTVAGGLTKPPRDATVAAASPSPSAPTYVPPAEVPLVPTTVVTPDPAVIPSPAVPVPTMPILPGAPVLLPDPAVPTTAPQPAPTAAPTTPKPVVQPTDYSVSAISVTNEAPDRQRSIATTISAASSGIARSQSVDVTVSFASAVEFRGRVTDGWSCSSASTGDRITVLICDRTLGAGRGGNLAFSVSGTTPHGTVTVSADGDPRGGNDSREFAAPVWSAP